MNLPFNLAGSFGEPRPDHFHSGIDIKTNGVEGQAVIAIADGYVSRIRVSPYGYGKAIYITHPNGYTSVYGHLSAFKDSIEKFVHDQHYWYKQSELDLKPAVGWFKIKQGDTIAFSGNTGGSSAPHLHFEIRESKTEQALNPLDFYPKSFYVDTIPPQINKVKVYQFGNYFYDAVTNIIPLIRNNEYLTTPSPVHIFPNTNYFCISLEGFDKQDDSENKNGINEIDILSKGDTAFKFILGEINFDQTRMCNAFVDYNEMMNDNGYFYNCYQLKNNSLPYYVTAHHGMFTIVPNKADSLALDILVRDHNQNSTKIKLKFYTDGSSLIADDFGKNDKDTVSANEFRMDFTAGTFYDDVTIEKKKLSGNKSTSPVFAVFHPKSLIPMQKPAKVVLTSDIPYKAGNIAIVRQDNTGKETALETTHSKNKFYANTKELGTFYLKYDTVPPAVQIINYKDNTFSNNQIMVKATDELTGVTYYNGYIDDHWVNFYYDAKNDILTYTFDEYCPPGEHNFKIIVKDAKQNSTTITQHFKN